jgi:GAF domain-containing protein
MVFTLAAIKSTDKTLFYKDLLEQVKVVLDTSQSCVSNLSNLTSLLYYSFIDAGRNINWTGFYIRKNNLLELGPFQGRIACTKIRIGKGVCGSSASTRMTVLVDNVDDFRGHIACDSKTKSEIVIPIILGGEVYGVLDIDALEISEFDTSDKNGLENIVHYLQEYLLRDPTALSILS